MKANRFWYAVRLLALVVFYFIAAWAGLHLNAVNKYATLLWAPTGIALAALLLFGYGLWPGIMLASFVVNFAVGGSVLVGLGVAVGNTLEAVLGAYLVNRAVHFRSSLERLQDVLGLIVFAAFLSTAVSATVGVSVLLLAKAITPDNYLATWIVWWVGDMLGDLVIAPLLLVWRTLPQLWVKRPLYILEGGAAILLLVGITIAIFGTKDIAGLPSYTFAYLLFPVMVWVVLRFRQRGNVMAMFVVSCVAIAGTMLRSGSSAALLSRHLFVLQSFMGVTAITFLIVAAVVAERESTLRSRHLFAHKARILAKQHAHLLALNQAKDDFIGLASHQLRTPATSVKQYIGLLLEGYVGKLTKAQKKMLNVAYKSNEQQIEVINAILSAAQLETGHMVLNKTQVNTKELVEEIIQKQASAILEREQTVNLRCRAKNCAVNADRLKLGMVIENIIGNACKYSPHNTKIDVSIARARNLVTIVVKDQGMGMTKQDMRKLFQKFSRLSNPQSIDAGGTGLGLYLAKRIVKLHKGTITVSSVPQHGSTFTIKLPAVAQRATTNQTRSV